MAPELAIVPKVAGPSGFDIFVSLAFSLLTYLSDLLFTMVIYFISFFLLEFFNTYF